MHPRELEAHFGNARMINAWGGYSKATTRALEHLHYRGLLRVARRENGIRLYEEAPQRGEPMSSRDRLGKLIMAVAEMLLTVPGKTLHANILPLLQPGETSAP